MRVHTRGMFSRLLHAAFSSVVASCTRKKWCRENEAGKTGRGETRVLKHFLKRESFFKKKKRREGKGWDWEGKLKEVVRSRADGVSYGKTRFLARNLL